jgi:hypothetical protein
MTISHRRPRVRLVVAGHFNASSDGLHPAYAESCAADSGDQYLTFDTVEGMVAKIDYIWHCRPGGRPGGGSTPPGLPPAREPDCDPRRSDHCYIFVQHTYT